MHDNTTSNIAHKNVDLAGAVTMEAILKEIIEKDQVSQEKIEMVHGVRYYNTESDILLRDFRKFYVDGQEFTDYNKSNEKIVNNLHKKLVDQKNGYINSKPIVIESTEEELADKVIELLGMEWNDKVQQLIQGASNKGRESLQPFIDENGDFKYSVLPAEQVIFIENKQNKVTQAIRYYAFDWVVDDEIKTTLRVEVWDDEKVSIFREVRDETGKTFYQFVVPGTHGVTYNPEYHWYRYNSNFVDKSQTHSFDSVSPDKLEANSWGRVPILSLANNNEERSDLIPIKRYIDALDVVSSGFVNDLKDIQLAIWVLRGYEGESLADFMLNLQKFKAILLSNDDKSNAEPKTLDIPKEAREFMMGWLIDMIYDVGQGVNESKLTGGSITNVVIKAMYSGLDLKANKLITKLKTTLSEFMFFVVEFINERDGTNHDYKSINFVFNTSMIFNVNEIIEGLVKLKGIISDRTLLANLPMIDDVEKELELIAQEQAARIDNLEDTESFKLDNE